MAALIQKHSSGYWEEITQDDLEYLQPNEVFVVENSFAIKLLGSEISDANMQLGEDLYLYDKQLGNHCFHTCAVQGKLTARWVRCGTPLVKEFQSVK